MSEYFSGDFAIHFKKLQRFEKWYAYFVRKNPEYIKSINEFMERAKKMGLIS